MEPGEHLDLLLEAIALEADAHGRLLAGDLDGARPLMRTAADRYRASWEAAPPRSFGRLLGMLKAAVIAGDGAAAAAYARAAIGAEGDSPPSWYAIAIAALVEGDDALAARAAEGMRPGSPAFGRAADAIAALARHDGPAYARAVGAIVDDFAARDAHLTGVAIADTALMLELLAQPRGLAAHPASPQLPPRVT